MSDTSKLLAGGSRLKRKFAKLLVLLGSPLEQEQLAALRRINAALAEDGKDWHWLVEHGFGEPLSSHAAFVDAHDKEDLRPAAREVLARVDWSLSREYRNAIETIVEHPTGRRCDLPQPVVEAFGRARKRVETVLKRRKSDLEYEAWVQRLEEVRR
jgi:hypothetical protein